MNNLAAVFFMVLWVHALQYYLATGNSLPAHAAHVARENHLDKLINDANSVDSNRNSTPLPKLKRKKRILFGKFLTHGSPYRAAEYQAALMRGHYCPSRVQIGFKTQPIFNLEPNINTPNPHKANKKLLAQCNVAAMNTYCGGAAITIRAIQTSCTCVGKFNDRQDFTYVKAQALNAWEHLTFVFHGAKNFKLLQTIPYVASQYFVHQFCGEYFNQTISHNFGILTLKYPIYPDTKDSLAPLHTTGTLEQIYDYVVGTEAVCLFLGWGSIYPIQYRITGETSHTLFHTWRVIRSFQFCYWKHFGFGEFFLLKVYNISYVDVSSWVCSTSFGTLRGIPTVGDSGTPVTCMQNWFFGVHSYTVEDMKRVHTIQGTGIHRDMLSVENPAVYSMYELSYEYRWAFNQYIDNLLNISIYPRFRHGLGGSYVVVNRKKREALEHQSKQQDDHNHESQALFSSSGTLHPYFYILFSMALFARLQ